jgi:hypothetical protein
MAPLLMLNYIGDEAVTKIIHSLNESGLRVLVSFDSHHVRESNSPAPCPHHGKTGCDCQVAILLVYDEEKRPATLLVHGQDGETWISLVSTMGQQPTINLESKIARALTPFLDEKLLP